MVQSARQLYITSDVASSCAGANKISLGIGVWCTRASYLFSVMVVVDSTCGEHNTTRHALCSKLKAAIHLCLSIFFSMTFVGMRTTRYIRLKGQHTWLRSASSHQHPCFENYSSGMRQLIHTSEVMLHKAREANGVPTVAIELSPHSRKCDVNFYYLSSSY